MRLVVDTNVIISALIRDGYTRHLVLESGHDLLSPDFLKTEIDRHRDLIMEKSGMSRAELDILLNLLLEEVDVVPLESYEGCLEDAREIMGGIDIKDVPFLALAMEKECGIWSDDTDFREQKQVPVLTTSDVANGVG